VEAEVRNFPTHTIFSLGEKLDERYKDAAFDFKQGVIDRALHKDHNKATIGQRLYQENMKLLQL
jgi:hypothetical protein